MANFDKVKDSSNLWNKTINASASDQVITMSTKDKYLDRNIELTIKGASSAMSGDAAVGNVLSGKTFYTTNLTKKTGTMTNNARVGLTSEVGTTTNTEVGNDTYVYFRLVEGYYPATAWRGTPLSTFGTATKAQVLKGKTFTSTAGLKVEGTIETVTPSASTTASSASTSVTGMVTTTTNTGYSVSASATSGTASASAPAGYVASATSSSQSAKTASETKYIQKGVLNAGVSGNITFTPSVSTNMATISKPSTGTEGTDYYSITGSGSKSGTVSGTAGVTTEGYVKTETASGGSATGSIAANDKKYIAKLNVTTGSSAAPSSGTPTNIAKNTNIKISAGYNPSDLYYKTQNYTIDDFATSGKYTASGSVSGANIKTYSSLDIAAAATPALAITDSSTAITPAAISGDTSKYNITTSVTGKTTYTTAGWIATTGLAAATDSSATVGTIVAGAVSNLSSDVTVPSGTTPTTVARGRKFKVSKGWYPNDLYYQAQGDAHSAWTPSSDYYSTTNSGYGAITASRYTPSSTYYIKAGTATPNTTLPSGKTAETTKLNKNTYLKLSAGWYPETYYQVNNYTVESHSAGTITPNTTLASGATANTTELIKNTYIKIGAGYYTSDIYYKVKNYTEEGHTSYTPSGDYFTTTNTGLGSITANKYATSTYYIKAGTLSAGSGSSAATGTRTTLGSKVTSAPTNNMPYVTITGSGSTGVGTAGWVSTSAIKTSNTATNYYQIDGVEIKAPSSGTNSFAIKVPNGSASDTITFTFKVDSNNNVWVE